jgi:hypothetical protein
VRQAWSPIIDRLTICKRAIGALHSTWLKRKAARLRAEREAAETAAREAQRRADQLDEQSRAGGPHVVSNMIAARKAQDEADEARETMAQIPERAQTRSTLGGPALSLRRTYSGLIIEYDKCLAHYANHADVRAVVQRLLNADARGGKRDGEIPGAWIDWDES